MNKQTVEYVYNGLLLNNKKEQTTDNNKMDEFQRHSAEQKKLDSRECVQYSSIYMKFLNRYI